MVTDRDSTSEVTVSRWTGAPWFVAAGLAVVVTVIMLVTPVGAPGRASAPDCGTALSGGSEEYAQQVDWCVAARGGRVSASLAVLAIGGFLVVPGLLRRSRRNLDGRTGGGLALLALASTLLWLPQTNNQTDAWCGSPLIPTSAEVLQGESDTGYDQQLAECAGMRSGRVAWALIPAVAGVLVLIKER